MGTNNKVFIVLFLSRRMYEELLSEIGLTKSEIAVYFALLKLGSSRTGLLIKEAGIASGKAYLILDKLALKGLVTSVVQAGVKHYQAKDPERLIFYLKEKEQTLKEKEKRLLEVVPTLKAQYESNKYQPRAEIFEGNAGFKTFYNWTLKELKKGNCIDILGVSHLAFDKFEAFLIDWNKERIEKGIKMRILYNHNCRDYGKKREKMRLTEVRYMKKTLETPAWIDIFRDYVVTINIHGEPVCFLIKDKESADSYRAYFEYLWKNSER